MSALHLTAFLERVLQVLSQGGVVSTYKYAVLLALIDLVVEAGGPRGSVTTTQVAEKVAELYWPQIRRYGPLGDRDGGVLRQNPRTQAYILQVLQSLAPAPEAAWPTRLPVNDPRWPRARRQIERKLAEYPLRLLQNVGGTDEIEPFIYTCGWTDTLRPGAKHRPKGELGDDNRVLFMDGAEASLIQLAPVLRPLIQQQWLAKLRVLNGLADAELEDFCFGRPRADLAPVRGPLTDLQSGRCFYCDAQLSGSKTAVDHFLPWSRLPDDRLDNLVITDVACNVRKLNFLADVEAATRWRERAFVHDAALHTIAADASWPRSRPQTHGVAAATYGALPVGVPLWRHDRGLRRIEGSDMPRLASLAAALREGRGSLGLG